MSKDPPAGGVPEIDSKGLYAPGFANISAIMIRFINGPTPYKDPALSRSTQKKSTDLKSGQTTGQASAAASKENSAEREQSRLTITGDGDEVVQ